jgi:predicted nuclease with TOPRIM domain
MELLARLENIAFYVKELKAKCDDLEAKNSVMSREIERLQTEVKQKDEQILNLEETKKISKLAEGVTANGDKDELKAQIDSLIREIDNCLVLVKI